MIETFKIITGIYDSEVSPSLIIAPQYTRGHRYKIFKLRARLNIRKNFFMIRIVDIWNNLSDHVVSAPSVKSFESRLDKYWKNHPLKLDHTYDPVGYKGVEVPQHQEIMNMMMADLS